MSNRQPTVKVLLALSLALPVGAMMLSPINLAARSESTDPANPQDKKDSKQKDAKSKPERKKRRQPSAAEAGQGPARSETVNPIRNNNFTKDGKAKVRKQGGNPRTVDDILIFDGSADGDRQVDPQIAVGNGHVLHGTNNGIIIYNAKGEYVAGVPQREFNDGIDPKMFFDVHNRMFCFDLWVYWDKEKKKPVNVSVSETDDPKGAWNTYPIFAPGGVDGGGIGYSKQWIGYSFPGGDNQTFVLSSALAKGGKPVTVYHFAGSLGQPVHTQDAIDDLYFLKMSPTDIIITRVTDGGDGKPKVGSVVRKPHGIQNYQWPDQSPQKGTDKKTSSGDINPKQVVVQNRHIWFSHICKIDGRSAVQWHQFKLDGTKVQSGTLSHPTNSYIQTTLGVNKHGDVLVGFQETGPDTFISPRCAWRKASDKPNTLRSIISLGEGKAATQGGPWGDYSCCAVDGDNLTDLWTIQSIADKDGHGDTVIARIQPRNQPADDKTRE